MLHFCNLRLCSEAITFMARGWHMFDVYLSGKRDLLVVRKGLPIPTGTSVRWRKSKKKVLEVRDEIKTAVQRQGYYVRKLRELPIKTPSRASGPNSKASAVRRPSRSPDRISLRLPDDLAECRCRTVPLRRQGRE